MEIRIERPHTRIPVADESYIGLLRRTARELSIIAGFNSEWCGRSELVATELGTNIIKHAAGKGCVLLRNIADGQHLGVELIALDEGPGMDVSRALLDGVSTAGTMGSGLGAIKRLSTQFEAYSEPRQGTAILSRLCPGTASPPRWKNEVGGVSVALEGEPVCGDGWAVAHWQDRLAVAVIDGIGHGTRAHLAAQTALRAFAESHPENPTKLLELMHANLHETAGAVAAVAVLDEVNGKIMYSGIGNIAARIIRPDGNHGCVSLSGILGLKTAKIKEFTYAWEPGNRLLMHSDGLKMKVDLAAIPTGDPTLAAAMVFRDYGRHNDDATAVIVNWRATS